MLTFIQNAFLFNILSKECARAFELLESVSALELPKCNRNGNYEQVFNLFKYQVYNKPFIFYFIKKQIQCRRGLCYCVDDDGSQTSVEVAERDMNNLICE